MADDNNNTIINQEILVIIIIDGSVLIFCRLKKSEADSEKRIEEVNDVDNGSKDRTERCWFMYN